MASRSSKFAEHNKKSHNGFLRKEGEKCRKNHVF